MCSKPQNTEVEKTDSNIPYKHCLNCGAELNGAYCHKCGQQAIDPKPSIKEFTLEYLNNAYMWDPQLFRTLWNLIFKPGYLTNEFLSGRIISHMHPLKLNMFMLFVFLTMFLFFSDTEKLNNSVRDITRDERVQAVLELDKIVTTPEYIEKIAASPRDTVQLYAPLFWTDKYPSFISNIETIEDTNGESTDKWVAEIPRTLIEDKILTLNDEGYYQFNSEIKSETNELEILYQVWSKMVDLTTRYFPMIILLTAPFLAFSIQLVQRKDKRPSISHFIFALHYTALVELLVIFLYALHLICAPPTVVMQAILLLGSCTYLTMAFRRTYKVKSWFMAAFKALITSTTYLMINLAIFVFVFLFACFSVAWEF